MQEGLLPLLAALALAGFIRAIGGPERGPRLMGIAVVAAFLLADVLFAGLPALPPSVPEEKLIYLVVLGGAIGFALDLAERPARPQGALRLILPAVALLWLAWDQLAAGVALAELATLAALWGGGALVLLRLERAEAEAGGLSAALMLIAAALGVAGIAALGTAPLTAGAAVALAASVGGLALWGYGTWLFGAMRGPFGAATLFGGGAALLGMAYGLALSVPQSSRAALAVLLSVFFADLVAARIRLSDTARSRLVGPVLFASLTAIPALAAIGLATITSGR